MMRAASKRAMARLVRIIRTTTVARQMARTSRAMTWDRVAYAAARSLGRPS
jgi:hypothetical protein